MKTTLEAIYLAHFSYVHQTLIRFGVPERDCPDQVHEVFIVVGRKLPYYEGRGALTTWLFGIARRVAAGYRRRASQQRERLTGVVPVEVPGPDCPFESLRLSRARVWVAQILEQMSTEQQTAYALYEHEGLTGQQIADQLGVPLQTVFSRLRRARKVYDREVARRREPVGGRPRSGASGPERVSGAVAPPTGAGRAAAIAGCRGRARCACSPPRSPSRPRPSRLPPAPPRDPGR